VSDPGSEHTLGRSLRPHVLRDRQVLLRRVQPPQVPHQLQQAETEAGLQQLQGELHKVLLVPCLILAPAAIAEPLTH
jgi:hypothetical protein